MNDLPVVVIGAGPTGLAAAAELRERQLTPLVFERGPRAGTAVAEWNHVRLFSRWAEVIDPAARRLLDQTGWQAPADDAYPTGRQWATDYLVPLGAALGDAVQYDTEERVLAQAVIDASGTWGTPNPLGGEGLPALGEKAAADVIDYRVPDLDDPAVRAQYAGKHIAIAGSGHSALGAIVALAALEQEAPGTRITWLLRRGDVASKFGGGESDQLPARGALGLKAKKAVDDGLLSVVTGFRTAAVEPADQDQIALISDAGQRVEGVDRVVVLTGFRPELSFLSEVRLGLDPVLQAPIELAPLIDPNVHSCGTVYPHGAKELSHPEPGFYLAGMKSYGRAPTFLAMTGYEQVRSIAAAIAGDHDAAARVELILPETGVCGGAGVFDEPDADASEGGCCGAPQPELVTLTVPGGSR
ncbi:NAD(P)-binding protein [Prescottella agglutinans]|uniref:NAD(P)-binding protein n=1 Tax=Prescottella agglutinans TaxID=1644129 RepID=UPI003D9969E6